MGMDVSDCGVCPAGYYCGNIGTWAPATVRPPTTTELYQHLVPSVHSMSLQVFKILVNASHAQQDITVLFLDSQQLTL